MIKFENRGHIIFSISVPDDPSNWIPVEEGKSLGARRVFNGVEYRVIEEKERYLPCCSCQRIFTVFLAVIVTIGSLGLALSSSKVRQWFTGRQVLHILEQVEAGSKPEGPSEIPKVEKKAQKSKTEVSSETPKLEEDPKKEKIKEELRKLIQSAKFISEELLDNYAEAFMNLAPERSGLSKINRESLLRVLANDYIFQCDEAKKLEPFGKQPSIGAGDNVHVRDEISTRAVRILTARQGVLDRQLIDYLSQQCLTFVRECKDKTIRDKAMYVAIGRAGEGYSGGYPTLMEDGERYGPGVYSLDGVDCKGPEFLARLWIFTHTYFDLENKKEKENAQNGIVMGLAEGVGSSGTRICYPGKAGHLVIWVLQGRLKGLASDIPEIDSVDVVLLFFNDSYRPVPDQPTAGQRRRDLLNDITQENKENILQLLKDEVGEWLVLAPCKDPEKVPGLIEETAKGYLI